MKKTLLFLLAATAIIFGAINFSQDSQPSSAPVYSLVKADECTNERAAVCAVFITEIIQACITAMETDGVDIIADIRCARARKLITDKKDCIPCLCEQVKQRGWNWVECPNK